MYWRRLGGRTCRVWLGNVKAGDYLRDLQTNMGERVKRILKKQGGAENWINLAKNRGK